MFPDPRWVRLWNSVAALSVTVTVIAHAAPGSRQTRTIIDNDDRMNGNNLDMVVTNHGSIAYDMTTNNPGLIYPTGTNSAVVFAAGLWIGAKVNGNVRLAASEYAQEFVPGPMVGGTFQPDRAQFRNFEIERDGTGYSDYLAEAISQGAPRDANGDPLQLGDALIWSVFNDANPDWHLNEAGGTAPLGIEVQQSVFAFNRTGPLADVVFVKWRLANKGGNQLDSTYVSLWADPDVGGFTDDLVGCDTTLSLGYAYNATNADAVYGPTPPAVGFHLLRGATASGVPLGMTSFVHAINGTDPMDSLQAYHTMSGRRRDGSPIHVCDDPLEPITTYDVSGLSPDAPASCTSNWLDSNPADRRLFVSTGPFSMSPGDTQVVIVAIEVGRSTDRLASIDALRNTALSVQTLYDSGVLDPPTAVEAFVVDSRIEPDGVHLAWLVPAPSGTAVTVERRTAATGWSTVLEQELPPDRVLHFADPDVVPGERYGYRLGIWTSSIQDYSAESWVTVPLAPASTTKVQLLPGRPNPSPSLVRIRHYVPRPAAFRLNILDAHGRLIRTLTEAELQPGWYESVWDGRDQSGRDAASGTYFVRIEGAGEAETRKVVLMR
jgi:FlgD Ig-like domain